MVPLKPFIRLQFGTEFIYTQSYCSFMFLRAAGDADWVAEDGRRGSIGWTGRIGGYTHASMMMIDRATFRNSMKSYSPARSAAWAVAMATLVFAAAGSVSAQQTTVAAAAV